MEPKKYFELIKQLPDAQKLDAGHIEYLSEPNQESFLLPPSYFKCIVKTLIPESWHQSVVESPNGRFPREVLSQRRIPAVNGWDITQIF